MRRVLFLSLFALTGCSTAPVAGLLDCFAPGHYEPDKDKDVPRRPRDDGEGPAPPGVYPRDESRIPRLNDPVPVPDVARPRN